MGPLHEAVTWYKRHFAIRQTMPWYLIEKKEYQLILNDLISLFVLSLSILFAFQQARCFCPMWVFCAKGPFWGYSDQFPYMYLLLYSGQNNSLISMETSIYD